MEFQFETCRKLKSGMPRLWPLFEKMFHFVFTFQRKDYQAAPAGCFLFPKLTLDSTPENREQCDFMLEACLMSKIIHFR